MEEKKNYFFNQLQKEIMRISFNLYIYVYIYYVK